MKIFGLKLARWREWLEVLAEEQRRLTWRDWLGMAWLGLKIPFTVDRALWRQRMRSCGKCPIFDRSLHRCRPFSGSPFGCGCHVIVKAMAPAAKCWARENLPVDSVYGWEK